MIRIYRSANNTYLEVGDVVRSVAKFSFDELFCSENPEAYAREAMAKGDEASASALRAASWLPPLGEQEIWAAGVTYFRSRQARMEEAEQSGGDVFYDKVYEAERPELFFKATAQRARGHGALIRVRADSTWDVPEPELTLAINKHGQVFGYTIGNDVSSRSIEGENPLYLPQAKVYRGSCALGPALCVGVALPKKTAICLSIERAGQVAFQGQTDLGQIKRTMEELAAFLFRENEFPKGALLMTGTGVVPGSDFSLSSGDVVRIAINGLGELVNTVE